MVGRSFLKPVLVIGQEAAVVGAKLHYHDHFVEPFNMVH